MSNHLLPANATALEIALSEAIDIAHLEAGAEAIRRFKAEPPDSALPSLVWEYALEELLPYLPEPRLAIREGVLWQRLRGTPRSLAVALSWIGAEAVFVEQEAPGGAHWAEFQIDPGRWLEWEEIGRFIAVARLSAPARSRLARLYHGYDVRRAVLDVSRLGDALLSDYSGTVWADGATRVSFGRLWQAEGDAEAARAGASPQGQRLAAHARYARYLDRCLLSAMRFGCRPIPNPAIERARLREALIALGLVGAAGVLPERRFAKAQIALSEQWPLGATQACLPARVWVPADQPMQLGDALSSGIGAGRWQEVTERLEAAHGGAMTLPAVMLGAARLMQQTHALRADRHWRLSDLALSSELAERWALASSRERARIVARPAWPIDLAPLRRFARAEIVLSEQWPLGETQARTACATWLATDAPFVLGEITLCGPGALRYAALDALEDRRMASACDGTLATIWRSSLARGHGREARSGRQVSCAARAARHARTVTYRAQRWAGRWQPRSWTQARECLQSQHTTTTE